MIVKRRKLQWYGHVSHLSGLAKTILQGTVKGGRRQGRQRKRWEDNISEWPGLEFAKTRDVTVMLRGLAEIHMEMSLLEMGEQLMILPTTSFRTTNATQYWCLESSPQYQVLCTKQFANQYVGFTILSATGSTQDECARQPVSNWIVTSCPPRRVSSTRRPGGRAARSLEPESSGRRIEPPLPPSPQSQGGGLSVWSFTPYCIRCRITIVINPLTGRVVGAP